jgi:hypothetical protein
MQLELVEEKSKSGEKWTTRLTVIDDPSEATGWVWVDLERVADDSSQRRIWVAPRLAVDLIKAGSDVRVDQVRLRTTGWKLAAGPLAGLIRNEHRTLPLIVFSEDPVGGFGATQRRADETAKRLAGATQVMILTNEHIGEFNRLTSEGLGVWGGAARLYLPNSGPGGLVSERHRYISKQQLGEAIPRPAGLFASMLTGVTSARRPPKAYEAVRRELRIGRGSDTELLAVAELEINELRREGGELRERIALLEDEILNVQADLEAEVETSSFLRNAMQVMFKAPEGAEAATGTTDLAIRVGSIAEAIAEARKRLSGVVIPSGVEHDIEDLDSTVTAQSWGESTWIGLRALHVYAEAGFDGNFKSWCMDSGHPWAWPATDKKISMTESQSVQQSSRLRNQRLLPVAREVCSDAKVVMLAHLKIAEGGGPLAPRVYFHDDTRGPTGRVHIGFIGPHKYMENTRTN